MALVSAFHTDTDSEDSVHHMYDDCSAGERVISDGNKVAGTGGFRLCDFCTRKQATGKFAA